MNIKIVLQLVKITFGESHLQTEWMCACVGGTLNPTEARSDCLDTHSVTPAHPHTHLNKHTEKEIGARISTQPSYPWI